MKIGTVVATAIICISLIPFSFEDPSQETALSSSQTWQDDYQPDEYKGGKEEETTEGEEIRRPRGKRRRRMRKRPRIQPTDEDIERVTSTDLNHESEYERGITEDEGVTPIEVSRRRPGKRRRRPYRRYQSDGNGPIKPLRRRRKGGRKKIRPENHDDMIQTDNPQEQYKNEGSDELETTTPFIRTTGSPNANEVPIEEKVTEIPNNIKLNTPFSRIEHQDLKVGSNDVKAENEETIKPTAFGNKIFDRKKLFSNSRKALPVTSAIIRKFGPNVKGNISEGTTTVAEPIENSEFKETDKALIKTNTLSSNNSPDPTDKTNPQKLVNTENKFPNVQAVGSTEVEDEEPNYPKILPRPTFRRFKSQLIETTTHPTAENNETIEKTEQQSEDSEIKEIAISDSEFDKVLENLSSDSLNLTNFDDYILDLLKSKSGKEHLSKILASRNMTITQLLEHRERGSSKFHLSDIFPLRKNNEKLQQETTEPLLTLTEANSATSTTMPSPNLKTEIKDKKEIQFPSEDILGTFPKFISEQISKYEQKNENKIIDNETEGTVNRESREPRLFESMPEFTTPMVISTTKQDKHPTWRVIPNPKLRPVSVRGNYEEIPISHILNRPFESNANDIYLVDERDALIHHKKFGLSSSEANKSKDTFVNFKKIPASVKSAIIISGIILAVATFGFLSLLISCRVRQKRSILRAKQDMMCEHLQNDDFMASQQSLSPVLTKHQQAYPSSQDHHHHHHTHPNNRHYYLWRTIRRTFRYE